jgi:hypothetical protein
VDGKRSLNINIFLKQFRRYFIPLIPLIEMMKFLEENKKLLVHFQFYLLSFFSSNDDIINMIMEGEHDDFGAEKLKGLMKILPEMVRR